MQKRWLVFASLALLLMNMAMFFSWSRVAETQEYKGRGLGAMKRETPTVKEGVDVISADSWSFMPGVERAGSSLKVTSLNRAIVNQDGSGGYPNPSVYAAGPHIWHAGDFAIEAVVDTADNGGSMSFYGSLPTIYDEWRREASRLTLTLHKSSASVEIWDGMGSTPVETVQIAIQSQSTHAIKIQKTRQKVIIYVDGNEVKQLTKPAFIASGKIWLGLDGRADGAAWYLRSCKLFAASDQAGIQTSPLYNAPTIPNGLAYATGTPRTRPYIGAAVSLNPLMSDEKYRLRALREFSIWTTENELKALFVHPQKGVYSFAEADAIIKLANDNGIAVHGHALVFGEANPRWLNELPKEDLQQAMIDHIQTIMTRYKGRVVSWDVINEPLADNAPEDVTSPDIRQHIWYRAMGESYIDSALGAAHEADPQAELYINDWGLEADGDRWEAMLRLVRRLKAEGVPIHGVGFQAHVYEEADRVDPAVLRRHMQVLASLGLKARISEVDVTGVDETWQATQYAAILEVCLTEPNCSAFSSWGISDAYGSTTEPWAYPEELGDNLLWDEQYRAKPAYQAVLRLLESVAAEQRH